MCHHQQTLVWNLLVPMSYRMDPSGLNFYSILIDSRIHLEAVDGGSRAGGHPLQHSLQTAEGHSSMGPVRHYANAMFLCPLRTCCFFFNSHPAGDAGCTLIYKQVTVTCQFKLGWSWRWGNFSIPSNHSSLCDKEKLSKTGK